MKFSVQSLRHIYRYSGVIILGIVIFFLDYYELTNPIVNEFVLFSISILKAGYFIYFVVTQIRESAHREFHFQDILTIVAPGILVIILSFAIDYYCLFRIRPDAFTGFISKPTIIAEFVSSFYFSISVFTTAGFGDIYPKSTSAQVFVSTELLIAFLFTILIISNIAHIRESYRK